MINVGEQLVSSYLRYKRGCDFIETNIYTESQGEIDVIGLNRAKNKVYVCEVTIQLTDGFLLLKNDGRANTVQKFTEKFARDIEYANNHLAQYERHFMYWCPIVKTKSTKSNPTQIKLLAAGQANIRKRYGVEIECVVNERFQECIRELREYVKKETKVLQCPLTRFMQIEEHLNLRLAKLS